ncbi:MAG: polyprenyl synthetase family protein [Myxococcota bacterium]
MSDLFERLAPTLDLIEQRLAASLPVRAVDGSAAPAGLTEAMAYMLLAGGKRLRPLLVLESARAACADDESARAHDLAMPAALAVEYVHTYSLIHDDLPALDNDDLRRGRPTLHVRYDEATAILAGDSLLTDAFGFLAASERRGREQCLELSRAAGSAGMVGGQFEDLASEGREIDVDKLVSIHRGKTGRLFIASCVLGGLAVDAPAAALEKLAAYGAAFGLAFQIADDVLDVTGAEEERGKRQGKDAALEKMTYVRAFGLEGAAQRAREEAERAADIAAQLGPRAEVLIELAHLAAVRSR